MAENPNAYRCLVVLPTYNERDNIAQLVQSVLSVDDRLDVLVVDDSSPDLTAVAVREIECCTPRVRLIQRARKMGLGSAYVLGFETALREGFGTVCTMDADLSHDPNYLVDMLKLQGDYDVVICEARGTSRSSLRPRRMSALV
jgi:dolichol-phosphate mannosyltransferase